MYGSDVPGWCYRVEPCEENTPSSSSSSSSSSDDEEQCEDGNAKDAKCCPSRDDDLTDDNRHSSTGKHHSSTRDEAASPPAHAPHARVYRSTPVESVVTPSHASDGFHTFSSSDSPSHESACSARVTLAADRTTSWKDAGVNYHIHELVITNTGSAAFSDSINIVISLPTGAHMEYVTSHLPLFSFPFTFSCVDD